MGATLCEYDGMLIFLAYFSFRDIRELQDHPVFQDPQEQKYVILFIHILEVPFLVNKKKNHN